LDKREPLALDQFSGNRLVVVFIEQRLGIKQIELRWAAGHKQEDDAFGLRSEMLNLPFNGLRKHVFFQQRRQRHRADAETGLFEKVAASHLPQRFHSLFHNFTLFCKRVTRYHLSHDQLARYSFVSISSKLSNTFATMV